MSIIFAPIRSKHIEPHMFSTQKVSRFWGGNGGFAKKFHGLHGKFQLGKDLSVYIQVAATEKMPSIKPWPGFRKKKSMLLPWDPKTYIFRGFFYGKNPGF